MGKRIKADFKMCFNWLTPKHGRVTKELLIPSESKIPIIHRDRWHPAAGHIPLHVPGEWLKSRANAELEINAKWERSF
jgi:hypothetical protein